MRLVSWNVNGLRAVERKGCFNKVFDLAPDLLLIQETKASEDQLSEEVRNIQGFHSYFAAPTLRKGYSGVALYTKAKPLRVEYALGGPDHLDSEGRLIVAHFERFTLLNVYFPNGGQGPHRLAYKLEYYDAFLKYIEYIRTVQPNVIFAGDVNTAHKEIDLARPKENETNTGFLPVERAWLDAVTRAGYIDTFRYFYPKKKDSYTYWDMKTRARDRNVGWRIDYFFVSPALTTKLNGASIHAEIEGSDHCPISLDVELE